MSGPRLEPDDEPGVCPVCDELYDDCACEDDPDRRRDERDDR